MTNASLMHESGWPKPVLWDRDRVDREVVGVQDGGGHIYTCGRFMGKTMKILLIILQLKKLIGLKKKHYYEQS